jgi:type IV pilus assembly protein PilM
MFSGRESVLAVDLGSASLKAVEIEVEGGKPVLRRAAAADLPVPPDGDRENRPDRRARLIAALGDLMREMGVKPSKARRLVSSLPAAQVSIKQIRCPALPEGEIRSALVFEARKHLPVEGEVLMDYQVLARRPEELEVLLVATAKQAVVGHVAALEACGLKGGIIEAPSLALWNAYLELEKPAGEEALALLHIGAATASLSFFRTGGLFFTREIPIAGDRFTEDSRERFGGDFAAAERAKVARGLFGMAEDAGAGKAKGISLELEEETRGGNPSLQDLVRELVRSIRFYLKESGRPRIAGLALAGGSAAGPGLEEYLAREIGVAVKRFDPLSKLENAAGAQVANTMQFAQAVGMGLRGMHEFFPHRFK